MMTLGALRRPASVVATTLALAIATFTPVAASASTPEPPEFLGKSWLTFSPNGDGVRDLARRPFTLSEASRVDIEVVLDERTMFTQSLGELPAGRHVWTWDGKLPNGKVAREGVYDIQLGTTSGTADTNVEIDLSFDASVVLQDYFREPASVYPRSVQVHDAIGLDVFSRYVKRGVLTIRQRHGDVVLRRKLSTLGESGRLSWDARDQQGRPLKPGRYVAIVSGAEWIGNVGHSKPLKIWVSADRLVWRTTKTEVVPDEARRMHNCDFDSANGCGSTRTCGTVKGSSQFPGGLTFQSGVCEPYPWEESAPTDKSASSGHFLPIPDAIRGVDAIRVGFSGASTTPGESDPATLSANGGDGGSTITSSSGARTPWIKKPSLGFGQLADDWGLEEFPPGALWWFETTGDDSFDVDRFTVRARYLAPKG